MEPRARIPAQIRNRELSLNLLRRLAPAADLGTCETALELVRSPAAISTIRLTMRPPGWKFRQAACIQPLQERF
jgi:hypothetical protein